MFGKKEGGKITEVYCAICNKKSGFAGYMPKKEWNINGKLCSTCFAKLLGEHNRKTTADAMNASYKENITPGNIALDKTYEKEEPGLATIIKSGEDPLRVLKLRLAKGEVSKEEYIELRKILES